MSDKQTDAVSDFLGQIVDQRHISGITPEIRARLIKELREQLMDQIDRGMINALTPQQLDQFNLMMVNQATTDQQITEFFNRSGVNSQQIALDTMLRFRQYYLGA